MTTQPPEIRPYDPNLYWVPVRAAAAANVSTANAPDTVDGILLGPGKDRILLAGQTAPSGNGIYIPQESGSATVRTITAAQSTSENVTAGRLVWVSVTGSVIVTGANGIVTASAPGFLAPLSDPSRLDVAGGADGGTFSFKAAVALVRADDADANGDFVPGKVVQVRQGTNAGIWNLAAGSPALVISNSLGIVFARSAVESSRPNLAAPYSTAVPVLRPLGITVGIMTSLGILGGSFGAVTGII